MIAVNIKLINKEIQGINDENKNAQYHCSYSDSGWM